jgi:hypothetical protein
MRGLAGLWAHRDGDGRTTNRESVIHRLESLDISTTRHGAESTSQVFIYQAINASLECQAAYPTAARHARRFFLTRRSVSGMSGRRRMTDPTGLVAKNTWKQTTYGHQMCGVGLSGSLTRGYASDITRKILAEAPYEHHPPSNKTAGPFLPVFFCFSSGLPSWGGFLG